MNEQLALQDTTSWAPNDTHVYQKAETLREGLGTYKNPGSYYQSPVIHRVTLRGLVSSTRYYYKVPLNNQIFSFTTPNDAPTKPKASMTIGLTADLGQTAVSNASISALLQMKPLMVLLSGDLSYADGWGPRWDSYGLLMQRLAAQVPVMTAVGNHEVGNGEQFVSYKVRYPMPYRASQSTDATYWSRDIEMLHVGSSIHTRRQ